jgi:hypothetical protein
MLQRSSSLVVDVREEGLLELLRARSVIRKLSLWKRMCRDPNAMSGGRQDKRSTPGMWGRHAGRSPNKRMPRCASDTSPGRGTRPRLFL